MKKLITLFLILVAMAGAKAQNGLEQIIVEKYYVSNAADSAGSIGVLPVGSVTYRIYVDMLPGYKFQAAYGNPSFNGGPAHPLFIQTSTSFFNNEDRGATTPTYTKTNANKNTVMLDSWISCGAACVSNFGVLKSEDTITGGTLVVNANGLLLNNDPSAGIPLTQQDGFYAGTPGSITFVGITSTDLAALDATSQAGNSFTVTNGSWSVLGGISGPLPSNKVLIAQLTTKGALSFKLNIQIGTPLGGTQNYVAENPTGNEISIPSLTYPVVLNAGVSIASNVTFPVCSGKSVTFTATPVNGGSAPSYQWKKNGVNVGTNSPTFTSTSLTNGNVITCVMTSNLPGVSGNPATSNAITAQIKSLPAATITTAGPTTYCSGANSLTLNANTGTGLTYKWFKGTTAINGATAASYVPVSTVSASYKVQVTNTNGCSKTSATVAVTVNALPAATATAASATTFCSGDSVTINANTGTGLTYQWFNGVNAIANAVNGSYVAKTSATYKVQVTNANGCTKLSSGVVVKANALPTATITASGPLTFCAGDSVTLTANSGTGFLYQWIKGTANISNATAIAYVAKTAGSYKVRVTNANGCSRTSAAKTVVVNCRLADAYNQIAPVVYPNPSNGNFNVSFTIDEETNASVAFITLSNMLGQEIYSVNSVVENGFVNLTINKAGELNQGLYLVKVLIGEKEYTSKLIVN